jgi:Flp pilus assembly protein TadG
MSILRNEKGTTAVEYALIVPILLTLVLGVMDLGLYLFQWEEATKATQVGARKAVVSDPVVASAKTTGNAGFAPGTSCMDTSKSPPVSSACAFTASCSGNCSGAAFDAIFANMQAAFPSLKKSNVAISYTANGFGEVGIQIPANVTVSITGLTYQFLFLSIFESVFAASFAIPASSATLSSEVFQCNPTPCS